MNKKKILWSILLIVVIFAVILLIYFINENTRTTNPIDNKLFNKDSSINNEKTGNTNNNIIKYVKKELDDGILYSIDGKEYKADLVIGDNYFDTTITDMFLNPETYMNKNI